MSRDLVFDNWTPLSYKGAMSGTGKGPSPWVAPTWVGEDHSRRLLAYKIMRAYDDNAAREFRPEGQGRTREENREYGDAALMIDTVMSALLGESQTIAIPGADDYNPEAEEEIDEDQEAAEDVEPDEEAERAWILQEWLREWADNERLPIKMIEAERNAVGLGDGVYTLGWSGSKGRPRLRVFDPGFYFPVLSDNNEDDFPDTVHLAWEVDQNDPENAKRKVRRITWRLAPIEPRFDEDDEMRLVEGDRMGTEGRIQRQYPWNEEPTHLTCYLTDAVWDWDPMERRSVVDFDESTAEFTVNDEGQEIRDLDLQIDFIPVVHVPNTVGLDHYGQSSLMRIMQILDDLTNADTDLQAASATTGTPPIGLSGATMAQGERLTYRPGEVLEVGPDGKLDMLDTSKSLDALLKYIDQLLSRLSTNARLPAAILGRVEPSEVPSGISMLLSFGPLSAMIGQMRLVRKEKYPLILKFAHRLAVAGGAEDAPPDFLPIRMEFGAFLPEDRAGAIREVTELLLAKAISLETAVRMLQTAGLPIEDAVAEVQAIESRLFEQANFLLDATGNEAAVYEFLGMDPPVAPIRPEAPPPGAPESPTAIDLPPRDEDQA